MDYTNPIVIFGNFAISLIVYICAYIALTPRMKLWKILLFSIPPMVIGYAVPPWLLADYALLRSFVGFGIIFLPMFLFYSDRLYVRAFFALSSFVCIMLTELVALFIFPELNAADYFDIFAVYLPVVAFFAIIATVIFFFFNKKKRVSVSQRDKLVMLILPYSQGATLFGWIKYVRYSYGNPNLLTNGVLSLAVTLLFCITADVILFLTLRRSTEAARLEAENAALAQQVEAQKKYYSMLDAQFTTIRQIRHDISNHMYTISALIDDGKTLEASKYAEEYLADASKAGYQRICDHPSANAFLFYKRSELEEHGISADFKVELSAHSRISEVDIVTVLGNLLDNADEACRSIPGAVIKLTVFSENGYIMILTENPCLPDAEHLERLRGMSRGVGFTILSGLAEKYNGTFSHDSSDGVFRCAVSLKE